MGSYAMKYSDKCERLSHSEHTARAMLMGLHYDWRDGTYCKCHPTGGPSSANMLDCLTLELITYEIIVQRESAGYMVADWDKPEEPTPWAKMG